MRIDGSGLLYTCKAPLPGKAGQELPLQLADPSPRCAMSGALTFPPSGLLGGPGRSTLTGRVASAGTHNGRNKNFYIQYG